MKYVRWIIGSAVVVAAGIGGYFYWRHSQIYPSTDDAYVQADVVTVSPQLSARVTEVAVHDHQHVTQGQLLVHLDPASFRLAVESARARLALARQQAGAAGSGVRAARAVVEQRQAALNQADANASRMRTLYRQHTLSKATLDDALAALKSAHAALAQARANLKQAQQEQGGAGDRAALQVAQAALDQARLELSYTRIVAPADGELGEVDVQRGEVVQPGQALFPLVKDGSFWVAANFKEGDLPRIRPGEPATVTVDMLPDVSLKAVVQSISPASGTAFSLLPPENATGNWVKVSQRFPVRIALRQRPQRPLRIGASAGVTVDTSRLGK